MLNDLQQTIEMCSLGLRLLDNLKPGSTIESKTRSVLVSESVYKFIDLDYETGRRT